MIRLKLTASQQTAVNKQQLTPVTNKRIGAYFTCLSPLMRSSEGSTWQRRLDGGFSLKDVWCVLSIDR
jgi:hypothetical protein